MRRGLRIAAVLAGLVCVALLVLMWVDRQPKGRPQVKAPPPARGTTHPDTGPRHEPVRARASMEGGRVACRYGSPGEPGRLWAEGPDGRVEGHTADTNLVLDLAPGEWAVHWSRPSRSGDERSVLLGEVEVGPGDVLTCDLSERGYLVRGRVVDTRGEPAAGADLTGCRMDVATTGPDGTFETWVRGGRSGELGCTLAASWRDGLLARPGSKVEVSPLSASQPIELTVDTAPVAGVGIRFEPDTEDYLIAGVEVGGPADRAELLAGDRVLAVDGTPTAGMEAEEFVRRVTGREGSEVRLTVEQDGEVVEVPLRRERIAPAED